MRLHSDTQQVSERLYPLSGHSRLFRRMLFKPVSISRAILWAIALTVWTLPLVSLQAHAQEAPSPEETGDAEAEEIAVPPNLEIDETDPLYPRLAVERPLSPQERRVFVATLDELNTQANRAFAAGNVGVAFELWLRELRLRRLLGPAEEVASLRRVGAAAWQQSQTTEVRLITQRLQEIEQETLAQTPTNYDLLLEIAQTYQMLRARDQAVASYQRILTQAREQGDRAAERSTLSALGELHLGWFDYPAAAETYQQLLTLARDTRNGDLEVSTLQQLAYVYQEGNQPRDAIAVQEQRVRYYERRRDYTPIPPIKIAIADAYRAIDRPDRAAVNYQEAFAVARSGQQYAYASEALQKLADLYRALDRLDDALVVYQLVIDVEQQAYSTYGMMEAYNQIGLIHRSRNENNQALAAFRRALELAQQLQYKEDYFSQQIQEISRAESEPETAPSVAPVFPQP